ncbi:TetR/AcrR family transcriptional regulator [Fodinicola acaciae]|uniref:TetR/AcrR family transcriptional regulator n=1 Tax=Fodinicola acaciae TaxID=2681555 RepID=UPI0013CF7E8C|nr:TetR/AcrR family transcriptional regulator [Fodinicola acaciae]
MNEGTGRRQQHRQEMLAEIVATTRDIVVADGPGAVTIAAVAGRIGVTPPALYRYADGREGLLGLAREAVAEELTNELLKAQESAGDSPAEQVVAVCRQLRDWALRHRAEFGLLFGMLTALPSDQHSAAMRLARIFEEGVLRQFAARPFPVPADEDLPERLRTGLSAYRERLLVRASEAGIPLTSLSVAATAALLDYWTRVYGLISMEVYGQLAHAVHDGAPLLDAVLAQLTGSD